MLCICYFRTVIVRHAHYKGFYDNGVCGYVEWTYLYLSIYFELRMLTTA